MNEEHTAALQAEIDKLKHELREAKHRVHVLSNTLVNVVVGTGRLKDQLEQAMRMIQEVAPDAGRRNPRIEAFMKEGGQPHEQPPAV